LECYGHQYGKREECGDCDLAEYCGEAKDIKSINAVEFIENVEEHNEPPKPSVLPSAAAINFISLVDAAIKHQTGWRAVKAKMLAGTTPLAKLAEELGFKSKQALHYHILRFCRLAPSAADAIPMDRRYQRHRPSPYYIDDPPWIDNDERKKRAAAKRAARKIKAA
jgi:hypothetical protein